MKRILLTSLILIAAVFSGFTQFSEYDYNAGFHTRTFSPNYYNPFYKGSTQADNLDFHFTNSASFSSFSGFGSVINNTISPSLNYTVSKKFSVQGGFDISYNYINSRKQEGMFSLYPGTGHVTTGTIWLRGNYFVNEKLRISATGYKQFSIWDKTDNEYFNAKGVNNRGLIFDVNYSPSRNVNINARFEYHKGNTPRYNNYWIGPNGMGPFTTW